MKKRFWYFLTIAGLIVCNLLAGCSQISQYSNVDVTSTQVMENSSEEWDNVDSSDPPPSQDAAQASPPLAPGASGEFHFRYIHRGFTPVSLADSELLERFRNAGPQIITNQEGLDEFTQTFCPGIPYDDFWDFSRDCLVGFVTESGNAAYAASHTITQVVWENGTFVPEFEVDQNNLYYAQNIDGFTHFFVEIIAISQEPVENSLMGQYDDTPAPTGAAVPSRTVFHGFVMASLEDQAAFDRYAQFGAGIIETPQDWEAFVSEYCPGLPCDGTLDFANDSLWVWFALGARPTYATADSILGVYQEDGYLTAASDAANRFYALNTADHTHFSMYALAIPQEYIPSNAPIWTNKP